LERRAGEWVTAYDLLSAGAGQPAAAIADLRKDGHDIDVRTTPGSFNRYRLNTQLQLGGS
jgi:hypothetical protein